MNTVIFGKRGCGKSTYCKNIVVKSILPVLVVDTMNEYQKYAILSKVTDRLIFDKFKIRVVPESEIDFEITMRLIGHLKYRYGINVILDEIDMWSNPHYIPTNLENNLKFSRHYKLNIWSTVRSPMEVNKKITSLANEFIIFKVTEPRPLEYFKQFARYYPSFQ